MMLKAAVKKTKKQKLELILVIVCLIAIFAIFPIDNKWSDTSDRLFLQHGTLGNVTQQNSHTGAPQLLARFGTYQKALGV